MRSAVQIFLDLVLIGLASIVAIFLRDTLDVTVAGLSAPMFYIGITLVVAAVLNFALGIDRTIWSFIGFADILRMAVASSATVFVSVSIMFWVNRLDGVSRSLPILQLFLIIFALTGARISVRLWHTHGRRRNHRRASVVGDPDTVLIVGLNSLTDFYLRSMEEIAGHKISIVGLLGGRDPQSGRLIRQYKVLGTAENVRSILR